MRFMASNDSLLTIQNAAAITGERDSLNFPLRRMCVNVSILNFMVIGSLGALLVANTPSIVVSLLLRIPRAKRKKTRLDALIKTRVSLLLLCKEAIHVN
jgi:hypothetical protein